MRHLRWLVLVPVSLVGAACADSTDAPVDAPLARDLALAVQAHESLPAGYASAACPRLATSPVAPRPEQRAEAGRMLELAQQAEIVGDARKAAELLGRAARLDPGSRAVAYRLGRISEARGSTTAAVAAYCRYLSLGPAAREAAEVRARMSALSRIPAGVDVARGDSGADSRARPRPAASARVVAAPRRVRRAAATSTPIRRQPQPFVYTSSAGTVADVAPESTIIPVVTDRVAATASSGSPAASRDPGVSETANGTMSQTVSGTAPVAAAHETGAADVVGAADYPVPSAPAASRRQTRRGGLLGAVAGAVVGAAVGRDVKGAVVGAAAGGLLGAVVGHNVPRGGTWSPRP